MIEKALNWSTLSLTLAKEGYVVVPGLLNHDELGAYQSLADKTILADRADYPGSDRDVGFIDFKDTQAHDLLRNPPLREVLVRLLGER